MKFGSRFADLLTAVVARPEEIRDATGMSLRAKELTT